MGVWPYTLLEIIGGDYSMPSPENDPKNVSPDNTNPPGPPPPLDDEYLKWMVGEWEGITRSPMGTSKERMKCRFELNSEMTRVNAPGDCEYL